MWRQVHYNDVTVGEYFADPLVEDVPVVEANAVKALDDTHLAPGRCNAPIISRQPACNSACCAISASRAWRKMHGPRPVDRTELFACSAFIFLYLR